MLLAFIICLSVMIIGWVLRTILPRVGGKPDQHSQHRIIHSPHFDGNAFANLTPTSTLAPTEGAPGLPTVLRSFLFPGRDKNPRQPLPSTPLSKETLPDGSAIWLGHSTLLVKHAGMTWLTDPVFHDASPIPFTVRPFPMAHRYTIDELPDIDVVLISHDHYDHLDHKTIPELMHKVALFLVPLGVKAHLLRWGVPGNQVQEFDWYESSAVGNTVFTFTPARHFSGRGLGNNQTLWGSWVIQAPGKRFFFSGDSGYTHEFAKIGERYGPFDIAFIENGAYNERWSEVHMQPEETAQASVDLRATTLFPIHWGKFDLSLHHWAEPAERIQAICQARDIPLATAQMGAVFLLDNPPKDRWWEALATPINAKIANRPSAKTAQPT